MKPPLCPICKARHGLREPHVFPETVAKPRPAPSPNIAIKASPNRRASRNARWRAKNRDQYNAGMCELMKRKRAAARVSV
jgi:hypothetical protein